MTSATVGGVTSTDIYRDDDIRVSQSSGSTTTKYLIDANNPTRYPQVLEEHTGSTDRPTITYIIANHIIGQANTSAVMYLVRDGHGNTRLLTNAVSTLLAAYRYDAFSNPLGFTFATALTTHLTGDGTADVATDLEYQGFRYRKGFRFIAMDNIRNGPGELEDANLYAYVGDNPMSYIDLSGHEESAVEQEGAVGIGALVMSGLVLGIGASLVSKQLAHINVINEIGDLLQDLIASGNAAATALYSKTKEETQKIVKAVEDVIEKAEEVGEEVPNNIKVFPIFKSLGAAVYQLDTTALAYDPAWCVLTYNGPGNLQTDLNRFEVHEQWDYLMIDAPWYYQLDEFPYASTEQGGVGALAAPVPAWQNIGQGVMLSVFYRTELQSKPDNFLVVPINL